MAYSDGDGVNGFVIVDKKALEVDLHRLTAAALQFAFFALG